MMLLSLKVWVQSRTLVMGQDSHDLDITLWGTMGLSERPSASGLKGLEPPYSILFCHDAVYKNENAMISSVDVTWMKGETLLIKSFFLVVGGGRRTCCPVLEWYIVVTVSWMW